MPISFLPAWNGWSVAGTNVGFLEGGWVLNGYFFPLTSPRLLGYETHGH